MTCFDCLWKIIQIKKYKLHVRTYVSHTRTSVYEHNRSNQKSIFYINKIGITNYLKKYNLIYEFKEVFAFIIKILIYKSYYSYYEYKGKQLKTSVF